MGQEGITVSEETVSMMEIVGEGAKNVMAPVSYTHLDVYKRQGRYRAQLGSTMTAYFLGKVCLAKHLEPAIGIARGMPGEQVVLPL